MHERAFVFVAWIYQRYGRVGSFVSLLVVLAILALLLYLLNRLPESNKVVIWSKCNSCKYKRKRRDYHNTVVLDCPCYEKPCWNQLRSPACPRKGYEACIVCVESNPLVVIKREDIRG